MLKVFYQTWLPHELLPSLHRSRVFAQRCITMKLLESNIN